MEFIALGDTEDISASCHFIRVNGTGLVLDAGLDPERDGHDALPRFDIVHRHPDRYVDHALVTHAHHDHIGSLPVLFREFPHVLAHMTDATRRLLEFLLPASARLQRRQLREGSIDHDPLFTEDDIEMHSHLYMTHDLEREFDITGVRGTTPIKARFYSAGHILGSVGVELTFEEDGRTRRVFYTSDTNTRPQSIISGGAYPESTDILILESTLGADEEAAQTSRGKEMRRFTEALQTVLGRDGVALIPVFVMGRAQETLAVIGDLKERGKIDADVPVYTAGSMRAIADIYDKTRQTTPRRDPDFRVFDVDQRRLPRSDEGHKKAMTGPSIIVVSSGMMFEPTLSNLLARRLIEDEKNGVLLVGYSKEDSPAQRLLDAAEEGPGTEVELVEGGDRQPVNCTVGRYRFSGHSHRRDLLGLVGRLSPEHVILVHGDTEARTWMAEQIEAEHPGVHIHLPEWAESIEL